jgi:hypothetical protein
MLKKNIYYIIPFKIFNSPGHLNFYKPLKNESLNFICLNTGFEENTEKNINSVLINKISKIGIVNSVYFIIKGFFLLLKNRKNIDFLVSSNSYCLFLPSLFKIFFKKTKYIRYEVDYESSMRFKKNTKFQNILRKIYDKFIEKFVHKKCYKIITLNKYSKKRIIDSGIHKDKIEIIGLWKEDKYFTNIKEKYKKTLLKKNIISKEIFNKIKNKKVILSIGLISKERYILEMVELVKNFKEYTFIIGGIGDEQIITELKIKTKKYKNIIFLNFIKPNLIGEYTKISEIIYQVLNKNNLNNKYFMSTNKLFESIAGGCLFISTKNNEVEEINKKYSFCEFVNIKNFQRDINFILKKYEKNEKLLKIKQLNARKNFKEYNSQIARKNFKKLFFK